MIFQTDQLMFRSQKSKTKTFDRQAFFNTQILQHCILDKAEGQNQI